MSWNVYITLLKVSFSGVNEWYLYFWNPTIALNWMCAFVCNYLCYMNELGEDFCSLLWGVSVEDHELDPLGDSVAEHDRALERRIIPHWAMNHVTAVVQELTWHTTTVTAESRCKHSRMWSARHNDPLIWIDTSRYECNGCDRGCFISQLESVPSLQHYTEVRLSHKLRLH